ncbi:hypothetical protein KVR01_002340 [Diaporthe batatas]|uniref:uncharacterized protein n=1 Tax=Diaporthe batatas TaxID=748121 RepID=UPI001D045AF7|nr:uncharacterized protein KVR01_002340 [Diaporthe batatas]KAG8166651.1 hypothetical protein KVR01_002340 [Diaporthe batatas]
MSDIDQAGRTPAMKPFSYTAHAAQEQRPRGRAGSNSSASSATTTASTKSHDQFVFSPHQTPASEKEPFFSHQEFSSLNNPRTQSVPSQTHDTPTSHLSSEPTHSATSRSRPIVIELPSSLPKRPKTGSAYTPIPPLSARGDISGGYFPFHEDPEDRIHRPHPFHTAEKEARRACDIESSARSIESTNSTHPSSAGRRPPPGPTPISAPPRHFPMLQAAEMPSSRGHTPVTSYVPSGLHETPLPVGKYYPSNYEQRQKQSHHSSSSSTRRPSAIGPSSVKSDTVVPQINRADPRGRPDSEAKMRLLQYQRDMITQAQLAKQRLEDGGSSISPGTAGHQSARLLKTGSTRGPISPRLQPLGSPGPVTPLALEGADGYLSARSRVSPRDRPRPVLSPDAGRENHAVARAMKARGERRRREGRCSPAVEAGGFGF